MRSAILTSSVAVLAMLTACDSSTDPESSPLTAQEARAIALALDDAGNAAVESRTEGGPQLSLAPSPGGPALDLISHAAEFDLTAECDLGGSAAMAGEYSLTIETGEGIFDADVDLSATADYLQCAFLGDNGVEIELEGAVAVLADRHFSLSAGTANGSQSYVGSVAYLTSNGKQGTCPVDVEADFSLTNGSASRTVIGTVCEHTVNTTTNWTKG